VGESDTTITGSTQAQAQDTDSETITSTPDYKHHWTIVRRIRAIQGKQQVQASDSTVRYGVPLVPTVFDPQSFSSTIERLFYLSQAVKHGLASVFLDQENELHVGVMPKPKHGGHPAFPKDETTVTQQFVFSLDQSMYRELLDLYELCNQAPAFRL
jgi:hypothetical protein